MPTQNCSLARNISSNTHHKNVNLYHSIFFLQIMHIKFCSLDYIKIITAGHQYFIVLYTRAISQKHFNIGHPVNSIKTWPHGKVKNFVGRF